MKKTPEVRSPSKGHIALRPRRAFGDPTPPKPDRGAWGVFRVLRAHLNIDFRRPRGASEGDES